ncbi:bifunctional nuclease family protein [Myxococcota bacterium]|nr:bifunctional nuclease family protein [Myxococcota bacterium]MBU1429772.1 bifunctional nuclease family protein [Myxococcota bacterium]MBU1898720.1 bifunctional nuclease family protein [Myxococcota bacterium]
MSEQTYIDFTVRGLAFDQRDKQPILLLQDHGERLIIPLVIGRAEARAIAGLLEGHKLKRPMTHDLLSMTISALNAQVIRVEVYKIEDETFYAYLILKQRGAAALVALDCRPSDAITVALKVGAPIRVKASLLTLAHALPEREGAHDPHVFWVRSDDERARLAELLEDLAPEDFGDYEM